MLKALGLPQGWRKKLLRAFGDEHTMDAAFAELTGEQRNDPLPEQLAGLVAEGDEAGLARMLETEMLEAGISPGAGRTPSEIARRLIEKEDLAATRFPSSALEVLKRFLATRVSLEAASITLRAFAADNALDLNAVLQNLKHVPMQLLQPVFRRKTSSMTRLLAVRSIIIPALSTKSARPVVIRKWFWRVVVVMTVC